MRVDPLSRLCLFGAVLITITCITVSAPCWRHCGEGGWVRGFAGPLVCWAEGLPPLGSALGRAVFGLVGLDGSDGLDGPRVAELGPRLTDLTGGREGKPLGLLEE